MGSVCSNARDGGLRALPCAPRATLTVRSQEHCCLVARWPESMRRVTRLANPANAPQANEAGWFETGRYGRSIPVVYNPADASTNRVWQVSLGFPRIN